MTSISKFPTMSKQLSSIQSMLVLLPGSTIIRKSAYGVLVAGAVFGLYKGVQGWFCWQRKRQPIDLMFPQQTVGREIIEPIVNIGKDMLYFGGFALLGTFVSVLTIVTSPVSIPAIAFYQSRQSRGQTPALPEHEEEQQEY